MRWNVGAVLRGVVDAVPTEFREHVLPEDNQLLGAELQPARVGGELRVRHALPELRRDVGRQGRPEMKA